MTLSHEQAYLEAVGALFEAFPPGRDTNFHDSEAILARITAATTAFGTVEVPECFQSAHALLRQGAVVEEAAWQQINKALSAGSPDTVVAAVEKARKPYMNGSELRLAAIQQMKGVVWQIVGDKEGQSTLN